MELMELYKIVKNDIDIYNFNISKKLSVMSDSPAGNILQIQEHEQKIDRINKLYIPEARKRISINYIPIVEKQEVYDEQKLDRLYYILVATGTDEKARELLMHALAMLRYEEIIVQKLRQEELQHYQKKSNDVAEEIKQLSLYLENKESHYGKLVKGIQVLNHKYHISNCDTNGLILGEIALTIQLSAITETEKRIKIPHKSVDKITLMAPYIIDGCAGGVVSVEYRNQVRVTIGNLIKRIVYFALLRYEKVYDGIYYFDTERYNGIGLGEFRKFSDVKCKIIEGIPKSAREMSEKIESIMTEFSRENESEHTTHKIKLIIFRNFPEGYSKNDITNINTICVNAKEYGAFVVILKNMDVLSTEYKNNNLVIKNSTIEIRYTDGLKVKKDNITCPFECRDIPMDLSKIRINNKRREDTDKEYLYHKKIAIRNVPDYQKTKRDIFNIPIGADATGNIISIDLNDGSHGNTNFATFICGAAGSGKSTLLHSIILGIMREMHPDDVEMWLVDFGMTELNRYKQIDSPHVKRVILDDSPELIFDIIDELYARLKRRENHFSKNDWNYLSTDGVKNPDVNMPVIVVIIDEFMELSKVIASNPDYKQKMDSLLGLGRKFGFKYIFSSQSFVNGCNGLSEYAKGQINQRIVMRLKDHSEIKESLGVQGEIKDENGIEIKEIPAHYAVIKFSDSYNESKIKLLHTFNLLKNQEMEAITNICNHLKRQELYLPGNAKYYKNKEMTVNDFSQLPFYADDKNKIAKSLEKCDKKAGNYGLVVGKPHRLENVMYLNIYRSLGENLLVFFNEKSMEACKSIMLSIAFSLMQQKKGSYLWVSEDWICHNSKIYENFFLRYYPKCVRNLKDICMNIDKLCHQIEKNEFNDTFIFIFGLEGMINEFSLQAPKKNSMEKKKTKTLFGHEINMEELGLDEPEQDLYDARDNLSMLLEKGSKYGLHFMIFVDNPFALQQCVRFNRNFYNMFHHKLLFHQNRSDVLELIHDRQEYEYIDKLGEYGYRYISRTQSTTYSPYNYQSLHLDKSMENIEDDVL